MKLRQKGTAVTHHDIIPATPAEALRTDRGEGPVLLFAPNVLQAMARRFQDGFDGLVTYAVKANDAEDVITNLSSAGIRAFDVASPAEMAAVRRIVPDAVLHYNNPVRTVREIEAGMAAGVASWAVDSQAEFAKIAARVPAEGTEIAVRFKLPVPGAAYDFGEKFGATPQEAGELLRAVAAAGFIPAMTFHPGTQCPDGAAWAAYIEAAARIADAAGVRLARLNVGGGFPARRMDADAAALEAIFDTIGASLHAAFATPPALVCEPGRAMVAECEALLSRVKAVRASGAVFLDDGVYGGLAEHLVMGVSDRIRVLDPAGRPRSGAPVPRTVFGPSCDSLDRLPGDVPLPADTAEGDAVIFLGMGAYGLVTSTRFNGYGALRQLTVHDLTM